MSPWLWWVIGILGFVLVFLPTLMSCIIYTVLLIRTSPKKWTRTCSFPEDEEYVRLYEEGLRWGEKHKDRIQEVSVTSDSLKLHGQYLDFGCKRAVIIIPGRTEGCLYGYHFAEPYRAAGYNVLVIDNRAHGLSQGWTCTFGKKEHRDILAWGKLLHDTFHNDSVIIHGVCIGASVALYTLVSPQCPDYFRGMTADGMFSTFYESFKNHMIEDKRPLQPIAIECMALIRLISGVNVVTDGPIYRIHQLKKTILFLHSREDTYSLPQQALDLYERCTAEKELIWFDRGAHSRIRVNNPEAYDNAVTSFWENK